jgi:hypothetical protein
MRPRKSTSYATKLTEEDVRFIKAVLFIDKKERVAFGLLHHRSYNLQHRLAKKFGVSFYQINEIAKGRRWKRTPPARWAHDHLRFHPVRFDPAPKLLRKRPRISSQSTASSKTPSKRRRKATPA